MPTYSKEFYSRYQDESRRSAEGVIPIVLQLIRPGSVIDVGCGVGTWLAVCKEHGVSDIVGVDGDYVDRRMLQIPADQFLSFDLSKPLRLDRHFDLVISMEVAEHLPPESAETFVESLVGLGPVVLFSAAIPFQGGTHHVNEQWPEYWAEHFRRRGYEAVDCIRDKIWHNDSVAVSYAQNALLFVKREMLKSNTLLAKEREHTKDSQLSIVHPRMFMGHVYLADPAYWSPRGLLKAYVIALSRAVSRRIDQESVKRVRMLLSRKSRH